MFSYILVLFLVGGLMGTASATADCSQKPTAIGKNCCKLPIFNFGAFEEKCSKHKPYAKNPCFLECIFSSSNVYDGENFNMENGQKMLSILFNGNQEFVDAYMLGFKQCEPEIKRRLAEYKAKISGSLPKGPDCVLFGYFFGMCAHEMLPGNCPKSAWTPSGDCEKAKEIAKSCKPLSFVNF